MIDEEYYIMAKVEHDHWWYKSLHNLVLSQIKKHFDSNEISIIDAGSGTGGLITFLKKQGYKNVTGFDSSDLAVKISNEKGASAFLADLKNISKHYEENQADVIIGNDVFYFLCEEDQRTVADNMHRILRKDGLLVTNMPSLAAFRGMHDVQVGIKKRFERKDIGKTFDPVKYSVITAMYWPFALSPIIWISRTIQRLKMKFNKQTFVKSDVKSEGRVLNSILFSITNFENRLLNKKPFGSSLFLVMKKRTPGSS